MSSRSIYRSNTNKKDAVSTDTASKIIESTTLFFLTYLTILQGINEHDRKDIPLLISY